MKVKVGSRERKTELIYLFTVSLTIITFNIFFLFSFNFKHLKGMSNVIFLNHSPKANSILDTNCQNLGF